MSKYNFTIQELTSAISKKLNLQFRIGKERNAWYELDGKKILRVTIPKGRGQVKIGTANSIRNQIKLSIEQYGDLIRCPISGKDYESIIREKIERGIL